MDTLQTHCWTPVKVLSSSWNQDCSISTLAAKTSCWNIWKCVHNKMLWIRFHWHLPQYRQLAAFLKQKETLWPVLCPLNLSPHSFPSGSLFWLSKPTNLDFVDDVVGDLGRIMESGLETDGGLMRVKLRCVTCDAPAKALVKSMKLYSGYYGCDKCTQRGLRDGHRVIYPEITNLTLRTDQSFWDQSQEEHHHHSVVSPCCSCR